MKRIFPTLAALLIATLSTPALAWGPFEDARQNLLAGDVDSVLLSITMGAIAVNSQDESGYTLLHYAVKQRATLAIDALLDRGADPSIKAKDGSTPLTLATDPQMRTKLAAAVDAQKKFPR